MMRPRLIFAIVSTIFEVAAIIAIVLWGLPELGIHVQLWILIIIIIAWVSYSVYTFRKGTSALKIEQILGLPYMIGTTGKVVTALNPEGMVRISGELWAAKSTTGGIEPGVEITVVGQRRLKLEVSDGTAEDSPELTQ